MDEERKIWHLKQCPLFSILTEEEKVQIARTTQMVELERNQTVPPPPENEPALYIVKRGNIELTYANAQGDKAAVMILGPGDVFGALTVEGESAFGESCRTLTEAGLCSIGRSRFEELIRRFPDLAFRLTKLSLLRIHRLQVRLAEMMMKPAEARLALALLELNEQVGRDHLSGRKLGIPLSHADLARLIGTSREMVTILMRRFRESNLVETPKRWIVLKDLEGLRGVAEGRSSIK